MQGAKPLAVDTAAGAVSGAASGKEAVPTKEAGTAAATRFHVLAKSGSPLRRSEEAAPPPLPEALPARSAKLNNVDAAARKPALLNLAINNHLAADEEEESEEESPDEEEEERRKEKGRKGAAGPGRGRKREARDASDARARRHRRRKSNLDQVINAICESVSQ